MSNGIKMDIDVSNEALRTSKVAMLVCHAHLDPVWLWEWEEGLGAALATFRSAVELCEEQGGFVFNQNEALLYEWVEEYDPALFRRIQRLVEQGRWHIMGGWFLQPDCNLPAGESIARHIERGLGYFREKFGLRPTTATNFDSFGHSRGLVQILRRFGYDSYLICRPDDAFLPLPSNEFIWQGFDGSEVLVKRIPELYNSPLGGALGYVAKRLEGNPADLECVLWGVGNHGGGPSRKDLSDLNQTDGIVKGWDWEHTVPEVFFTRLKHKRDLLPVVVSDINRWAVGCYTSQALIKQGHRALENELFRAEKMSAAAAANGLMEYPQTALREAERDLLLCEFHDILPGSSIQKAEFAALRLIGHGREILARVASRAFYALLSGEVLAGEGEYPVLVFNPHPWHISAVVDVEFQMADQNWGSGFFDVAVVEHQGGRLLPSQLEREASNMPVEWRKRVVFTAELGPSKMCRFDLHLVPRESKYSLPLVSSVDDLRVVGGDLVVVFSRRTGRLVSLKKSGVEHVGAAGAGLEVVSDVPDSWIATHTSLGADEGPFLALNEEEAAVFAGVQNITPDKRLDALRIVEDGPVRTVVEVLCGKGHSRAQLLYRIRKDLGEIEVEARVYWQERDRALKWSFGLSAPAASFLGQTMFGTNDLPMDGIECAFQHWCGVFDTAGHAVVAFNEGIYAGDCSENRLRLTLLRSAAYSAHAWENRQYMLADRLTPRMDQGERLFRFSLAVGRKAEVLAAVDRRGMEFNQRPYSLQVFPPGSGKAADPLLVIDAPSLVLSSLRADPKRSNSWIFRLFNPLGQTVCTRVIWAGNDIGSATVNPFAFSLWRSDGRTLEQIEDLG
jgi:alpha-mannosidase